MSGFRTIPFLLQFSILSLFPSTHAFSVSPRRGDTRIVSSTRRYNFFQNLINEAFSNDDSLSTDRKEGQLEGPGDDSGSQQRRQELTATQEKWRQMNSQVGNLEDRKFLMDFFLSGVPNKDPSNDLYGSKVNISSRDRQVGQALPIEPTVAGIEIAFLPEGVCRCLTSTAFTNSNEDGVPDGDWLVSEDGKQVRFRIDVTGYARTVETKGTIQAVAWSNEPDQAVSSSTTYSIPAGWLYGEATVSRDPKGNIRWENGILKVEQSTGLLGAGSKMTPCGKFQAQPVANYV